MARKALVTPSMPLTPSDYGNAMVIRRSRHKPAVGDLFVLNILGQRWVAGRVVRVDARVFTANNRLLYFYKMDVPNPEEIQTPIKPDLLIPPIITNDLGWRRGYFAHIRSAPLHPEELLPRHVFDNRDITGKYLDEYRQPVPPPEPGLPVGTPALWNVAAIDHFLSKALGIEPRWVG